MGDTYFNYIITRLTWQELNMLGVLKDHSADVGFKAMVGGELKQKCGLSDANFRKVVNRLSALSFIEIDTSDKEHRYYLTEFGTTALKIALKKAEEG